MTGAAAAYCSGPNEMLQRKITLARNYQKLIIGFETLLCICIWQKNHRTCLVLLAQWATFVLKVEHFVWKDSKSVAHYLV